MLHGVQFKVLCQIEVQFKGSGITWHQYMETVNEKVRPANVGEI